jgi:carboxylate-amine ligase
MRTVLPELLAVSSSSPWLDDRLTHLHSTRTQIFTRFFPRCGIPDSLASWDEYAEFVRFLIATKSIREHTEIWWSVRPHQAFPTVEVRISDAQPDLGRAIALAGLTVALAADYARQYDQGRALPDYAPRLLEENLWRAIRWGMSGELIDLRSGRTLPARDRIADLLDGVSDTARDLGIAPFLEPVLAPTLSELAIPMLEEGADVRELWPQTVEQTRESVAGWLSQHGSAR